MTFRPLFALLLFAFLCFGSTSLFAAPSYTIKAKITNAPANTAFYVIGLDGSQSTPLDTLVTNDKGIAEAKGNVPAMGLAVIRNGNNQILFVIENKTINFEFDFNNWMTYNISGSKSSEQLTQMIKAVRSKPTQAEQATYLNAYADTCKNPFVAYVAVSNTPIDQYYTTYEKVIKLLEQKIPQSRFTAELKSTVLRTMAAANPVVVAAYNTYKAKGFEIYSVSLDKSVEPWKAAIEKDQLSWQYHVSDLGGWNSQAAAAYAVGSIPQNFLLDKDGKIIAKNLRGEALEAKLAEVMK